MTKRCKCPAPPSELETILAFHLRAAKLDGLFLREFRFHSLRRWRFDFACPQKLLAVECEGGTYSGGRHTRGAGFESDCEKYAEAVLMGYRVLRFTRKMIIDGRALAYIEKA